MKRGKILIVFLVLGILAFLSTMFFVRAQSPSPTTSPTPNLIQKDISNNEKLKPFVAGLGEFLSEERYVQGKLIIKLRKPTKIKGLSTDIVSINTLNEKFKVKSIKKAFSDVGLTEKKIQQIKKKFPERAARAPKNLDISQLGKKIGLERIYELEVPVGFEKTAVEAYSKATDVEYAHLVYLNSFEYIPTDEKYSEQWAHQKLESEKAWDIEKGDPNIIVAFVDSGVDYNHEDLKSQLWRNPKEASGDGNGDGCPGVCGLDDDSDGIIDEDSRGCGGNGLDGQGNVCAYLDDLDKDDEENGYPDDSMGWDFFGNDNDVMDQQHHGTAVAGIIGAAINDKGVVGVCPKCTLMPIKVSGAETWFSYGMEGIKYAAENGADVISNSWGGYGYVGARQDLIDYVHSLGVVVVASAGNDNTDNFFSPSGYEHVIGVSATFQDDTKAGFSNYGEKVDVAAPGFVLTTSPGNRFIEFGGTSAASPHVSGLAGLLLSKNFRLTSEEVEQIIVNSVDKFGVDIPAPEVYMGTGRINAYRALSVGLVVSLYKAEISSPMGGSISLSTDIKGSANGDSFKLEIGEGIYPSKWIIISEGAQDNNGDLGTLNTYLFKDGLHTIRLTVGGSEGSVSDEVRVVIDNVFINEPKELTYRIGEKITVGAIVNYEPSSYFFEYSRDIEPREWHSDGLTFSREGTFIKGEWDTNELVEGSYIIRFRSSINRVESLDEKNVFLGYYKPGWPRKVEGGIDRSSPVIADIDQDGDDEIMFGTLRGKVYVFNHDGSFYSGWENGKFISEGGIFSSLAVGNIDADKELEIIANTYYTSLVPNLYVFNHDGSFVDGWPVVAATYFQSSPVIFEIDGERKILIGMYDNGLKMFNEDGIEYDRFTNQVKGSVVASPSYGDIIKEIPGNEIAVTSSSFQPDYRYTVRQYLLDENGKIIDGWPKEFFDFDFVATPSHGPVLGDIDNNGEIEIIQSFFNNEEPYRSNFYVWDSHGNTLIESKNLEILNLLHKRLWNHALTTSLSLGNIDKDDNLELLYISGSAVAVIGVNLDSRDAWLSDYIVKYDYYSSTALGDINDDGNTDVLVGNIPREIYAFSPALCEQNKLSDVPYHCLRGTSTLEGWPKRVDGIVRTTPAIGDIDKDGNVEVVLATDKGNEGYIYILDLKARYDSSTMDWPMYQHDPWHSGQYGFVPDNRPVLKKFIRGDSNINGKVDLSDAVHILNVLFKAQGELSCEDAADANDDGVIDVSDAVFTLIFLFRGDVNLPQPYPQEGGDLTDDFLGCDQSPPTPLDLDIETGLLAYYSFDNDGGNTIYDSSGNKFDGFYSGAQIVSGRSGNAISFDGVDDFAAVPTDVALSGMDKLTISTWVKFNEFDRFQHILAKGMLDDMSTFSYALGSNSVNSLFGRVGTTASAAYGTFSEENIIQDRNFHHLAFVYNGRQVRLYLDGNLINSKNAAGKVLQTKNPLLFGIVSDKSGNKLEYFNGVIDEVKIYERALNDREIEFLAGKA